MANVQTGNPWVLDSVMAAPYLGEIWIEALAWTDQVAAGDQITAVDQNGNLVFDAKAQAANAYQTIAKPGRVNGFRLTAITSGKLFVYIK
jgi:hypothetical protein